MFCAERLHGSATASNPRRTSFTLREHIPGSKPGSNVKIGVPLSSDLFHNLADLALILSRLAAVPLPRVCFVEREQQRFRIRRSSPARWLHHRRSSSHL